MVCGVFHRRPPSSILLSYGVVVLNVRLFKLLNNWWTSSKNRKRALATDWNGRHVVDEVHLRLLVLDDSSSTAGRSTHFETSY
ncbi:hypothetical protein T01_9610 [Trichinella spiralis]|uniref:Uncharacterized protein n=1 Tax=Trichinella spiralis TaxID=6334 RepID=A0A0V1B5X9_TRISP|nr:hypothetical protein T01_9610 [Trichinella spiralis]